MTTTEHTENIVCNGCGYTGTIETYEPCMSVYNDCRCPKCGSTDNEHNAEYKRDLFKAMRETTK